MKAMYSGTLHLGLVYIFAILIGNPGTAQYSKGSQFRMIFTPKGFIPKGYYSDFFNLKRSLFRKFLSQRIIILKDF